MTSTPRPPSPGEDAVPWARAWEGALYGERGFYRSVEGPAGHFATATHGPPGRLLARALLRLAREEGCTGGVVDVGAGRGELLAHLRALDVGVPLLGVDVVDRPDGLGTDVGWLVAPGGARLPDDLAPQDALVVAHEWLDVVPCVVAEADGTGVLREVLVEPATGTEHLGGPLGGDDLGWAVAHWTREEDPARGSGGGEGSGPTWEPGTRVEVGRSRDTAWAGLVARMRGGVALAVDYGHRADRRPPGGTLTAFRDGHEVVPVPDGSCDLTAHVAVDSLRADEVLPQRDALLRLGVDAGRPDHALARSDPASYVAALGETGAAGVLLDRGGYGGFWWVLVRP